MTINNLQIVHMEEIDEISITGSYKFARSHLRPFSYLKKSFAIVSLDTNLLRTCQNREKKERKQMEKKCPFVQHYESIK